MGATRYIIPGEDIASTPMLKLVRANRQAGTLWQDFSAWLTSESPQTRAEYSDGGRQVLLRANLPSEPPIDEWALQYGDAVHNYRAALDGLAWEVAHLDGAKPTSSAAGSIYFPLAKSDERWKDIAAKTLRSVPPDVLERIRSVQPFMARTTGQIPTVLLHELDRVDKHRSALSVQLTGRDRQPLAIMTAFDAKLDTGSDPLIPDSYCFLADNIELRDGVPVARMRARIPFADVSIATLPLRLDTKVSGVKYDAFFLLRAIDRHVTGTFMTVLLGGLVKEWTDYVVHGAPRPTTRWI